MTITEPTCTTPLPKAHQSLPGLAAAESQTAAAIALGRRLAEDPDPAWQLYAIEFTLTGTPYGPGLLLWTERQDAAGVQRWAERLGVEVSTSTIPNRPEDVHHNATGVIEGVPVHVWSIVHSPITNTAVCQNKDFGWHVGYDQGGRRRVAFFRDEDEACTWVARTTKAAS